MRSRSRRSRTKEIFWRKVLGQWKASGLTQAEFCRRENVNQTNLSWWKREIADRDSNPQRRGTDKKIKSDASKVTYWRALLEKFESSDLDIYAFCTKENVKTQALRWWRGELVRRDRRAKNTTAHLTPTASDAFVPINVAPPVTQPSTPRPIAEVEIHTGLVRIFDTSDCKSLVVLFSALKELNFDCHDKHNENISLHAGHRYAQEL